MVLKVQLLLMLMHLALVGVATVVMTLMVRMVLMLLLTVMMVVVAQMGLTVASHERGGRTIMMIQKLIRIAGVGVRVCIATAGRWVGRTGDIHHRLCAIGWGVNGNQCRAAVVAVAGELRKRGGRRRQVGRHGCSVCRHC